MPRRDTMRLRSSHFAVLLLAFFVTIALWGQGPPASQPPAAQTPTPQPANSPTPAAPAQTTPPASGDPNKPANSDPNAPDQSQQPAQGEDTGVFVFKKQVEEVVLHATVVDD